MIQSAEHLDELAARFERLERGVILKLKEVPFKVRLFKRHVPVGLVATVGDIDWVITIDLDETVTAHVADKANDVRWQVEELHRVSIN